MEVEQATNTIVERMKIFFATFDLDEWLARMGLSYSPPVQAALWFGSGFAIGFLFKKHFKFLFGACLFAIIFIKILEYNEVLVIDWASLRMLVGFAPDADFNEITRTVVGWIRGDLMIFLSALIGFLIGCKLG